MLDPIAALQVSVTLEPRESEEIAFVLGVGQDRNTSIDLWKRFATSTLVNGVFEQVKSQGSIDPAANEFDVSVERRCGRRTHHPSSAASHAAAGIVR